MADLYVTRMPLGEYLAGLVSRRFAFGELDCCTLMADWLCCCGLPDPMADRRGTYSDYRGFRAAIRGEGGLVRSCADRFAGVGLEIVAPAPGDVCLVAAPLRLRRGGRVMTGAAGAICVTEKLRAVVTPDAGLVLAELSILRAWGVRRDA